VLEAQDVPSARVGATANEKFVAIVAAANPSGDVKDSFNATFEPTTRGALGEAVDREGIRFLSRLELKPGRYALRVAATDGVGTTTTNGSVYFDLDVPDFSKTPLALSGVLVSTQSAHRVPTIGEDASSDILQGPATAMRAFSRDDTVTTLTEIYDRERRVSHQVDLEASVRTTAGDVVYNSRQAFERTRLNAGQAMVHSIAIPLSDLAPGDYLLTIDAATRLKAVHKASRHVVFSVR
jgi:hypothetical protein